MQKLPQMAKQLEVSLYRDAQSFEAYMDMGTLKQRLQKIAVEVSRKTRNASDNNSSSDRSRQSYPDRQQHRQQQPQVYARRPDQGSSFMPTMNGNQMDRSNGMMMGGPNGGHAPPPPPGYPDQRSMSGGNGSNRGSMSRMSRDDPEMKVRIRHKQQRLLLLHHSAKCPHEDGRCTVTPHCVDMKRLWRHMEGCKDNQCKVAHCFSSRAILSHYRKCREANCPACGPVRETVRRNRSAGGPSSSSRPGASTGDLMDTMRNAMQQQQNVDPMGGSSGGSGGGGGSGSFQEPQQQSGPSSSSRGRQVNMPPPSAPSTQGSQYSIPQQPPAPQAPPGPQASYNNSQGMRNYPSAAPSQQHQSQRAPPPTQQANGSSSSMRPNDMGPSSSSRSGSGVRNETEQQKIRHKQQRLLLLRHASRCQHEAGKCPVTPHCASMKRLWEHIAHCKNQSCTVQHCLSSRYVLSHYRRCKDPRCPACGPVRDTIRKSSQRESANGSQRTGGNYSFDNPTHPGSNDVTSPPHGSMSPTPSNASSTYEREPKRVKKDDSNSVARPVPSAPDKTPSIHRRQPPPNADSVPKPEKKAAEKRLSSKENVDHSLLNSFTVKQLETHLASLDRKTQLPPAKLKSKCLDVLKGLQSHQHGWVFNCPVDPVELGLPDYFDIIKKPMDLGTVQKRLENGHYHSIEEFQGDVNRTFDNAMTYNENGSVVYDMAKELQTKFASDFKKMMAQLEVEDRQRRQNERACTLCGCEKLLFEPPVYFCNGMNCQSQRIRRNSHFYVGGSNQYFWCSSCYNELDDKIPIELVDMTIMKGDLNKKKNDEVHEESWVECDSCERWVHQVCGLFNSRQNKEHHSEYCCPQCLLQKRKTTEITPETKPLSAADLPRTTLSEWLEKSITKKVEQRKRELVEEKAHTEVRFELADYWQRRRRSPDRIFSKHIALLWFWNRTFLWKRRTSRSIVAAL